MTTDTRQMQQRNRHLARSTLIVMVAFAVAKAISLGQTVIIAQIFGVGAEWDAFVTANRIPELLFTLIAGGALAHAFIPIFSSYLAHDDVENGWRIASHVLNFIFIVTVSTSLIVFITAPWLVDNVIAPGFDASKQQQTVELMRILLISTMIFSVSGIVMGILQSFNHFLLPALAPIMFDMGILFGVIFLIPPFGVHGIAIGAVIGAALHLGVQSPGLIRYKAKWVREFGFRDPVLWQVIRLMLPRVAGLGVFSLNFLVMNNIASRLGPGSVSALDWGWRLMQIPQTLIGTAMGVVIFPTLAALSEIGDEDGKREAMSGALRFILVASIPSAVGLIVLGRPVISLLERGAFDSSASTLVYSTLQFFALGLIVHSALEVVARSFYADKDTLTPLWAALGGATINLAGALALTNVETVEALNQIRGLFIHHFHSLAEMDVNFQASNVGALALANSFGVMFEVGFLVIILRQRWQGANEDVIGTTIVKTLIASLLMGLSIILIDRGFVIAGVEQPSVTLTIVTISIKIGVGAVVFLGMTFALRMAELPMLIHMLLKRHESTIMLEHG